MEEKNDIGLKHLAHKHLLILNETYIGKKRDACRGCWEPIDSGKSSIVYCCSNITSTTAGTSTSGVKKKCVKFLLHKTCAELPLKIVNPTDQNEFLFFKRSSELRSCIICGFLRKWHGSVFDYCSRSNNKIYVCWKCAVFQVQQSKEDSIIVHQSHSYHPLALIEHPSSFKCYACKVNDNILDLSYRCTRCQFWIHKSCGDAPHSFPFQCHKHPLILSFFLPEIYRRFLQHCRLCNERLFWIEWLYCCCSCRYFTHFQCARSRSSQILSSSEDETYPNLVHLPAIDELSLNLLLEQFVKDYIKCNIKYIIFRTNQIKHWSHDEHVLKLITSNELYNRKHDDETVLLICQGCVKPIRTDIEGLSYYGCVSCKYFMHKGCAEFPREIEHNLWPGKTPSANKYSEPMFQRFCCSCCGVFCDGIFYRIMTPYDKIYLHIGCVSLPKIIIHKAHHNHQLDQVFDNVHDCSACGQCNRQCKYGCKKCNFYICGRCIMNATTLKHGWDPHTLDLIYDAGMVAEHEHDFDCEYCSDEINTNKWFYHCSKCDLSFHPLCLENSSYRKYKYVKFGATSK